MLHLQSLWLLLMLWLLLILIAIVTKAKTRLAWVTPSRSWLLQWRLLAKGRLADLWWLSMELLLNANLLHLLLLHHNLGLLLLKLRCIKDFWFHHLHLCLHWSHVYWRLREDWLRLFLFHFFNHWSISHLSWSCGLESFVLVFGPLFNLVIGASDKLVSQV